MPRHQRLEDGDMQAMEVVASDERPGVIGAAMQSRTLVFVCGGMLTVLALVLAGLLALPPPKGSSAERPWTVAVSLGEDDLYHMHHDMDQRVEANFTSSLGNNSEIMERAGQWKFVIRELAGTDEWSWLRMQLHDAHLNYSDTSEQHMGPASAARAPAAAASGADGDGGAGNDTATDDSGDDLDFDDTSDGMNRSALFEQAALKALVGHTFIAKLATEGCVMERDDDNLNATLELAVERFAGRDDFLGADADAAERNASEAALRESASAMVDTIQRQVFDFLLSTPPNTSVALHDSWVMPRRVMGEMVVNVTFTAENLVSTYKGSVAHDPYPGRTSPDEKWLVIGTSANATVRGFDAVREATGGGFPWEIFSTFDLEGREGINVTSSSAELTSRWSGVVLVGATTGVVIGGNATATVTASAGVEFVVPGSNATTSMGLRLAVTEKRTTTGMLKSREQHPKCIDAGLFGDANDAARPAKAAAAAARGAPVELPRLGTVRW